VFHHLERLQLPALEKLNKIAYLTVAFALQRTSSAAEDVIKADFIAHLTAYGYPNAGEWLWGKPVAIRQPLLELLHQPLPVRKLILEALDADWDLERCFNANQFKYQSLAEDCNKVSMDCSAALTLVDKILENFYITILSEGAPGDKIDSLTVCDRQTVLKTYLHTQKIKVCPACDGAPPSADDYADKIREDIDHFFTKSRYPLWAIHPLNLTPFCKICNQSYKGQKDAIYDQDSTVADVLSPENIYHPYLRPARGEIDVVVELDPLSNKPHLKLKTKVNDPINQSRLHSLNYLLRLESRWNGDLQQERLQEPIKSYLIYSTYEERDIAVPLDENYLYQKLDTISSTIARSIGKMIGYLPASAYARWLSSDTTAQAERVKLAQLALI